jgi:hypothetical protein
MVSMNVACICTFKVSLVTSANLSLTCKKENYLHILTISEHSRVSALPQSKIMNTVDFQLSRMDGKLIPPDNHQKDMLTNE